MIAESSIPDRRMSHPGFATRGREQAQLISPEHTIDAMLMVKEKLPWFLSALLPLPNGPGWPTAEVLRRHSPAVIVHEK
jgi:hypothetical protein